MRPRYGLALLVLLLPGVSRAEDLSPEQLLPAGTQVYLRWDGLDAHRPAYARTGLGQMMQGDTGRFVNGVFGQVQEGLGALLTVDQLLGGAAPEKLQKLQADAAEAAKLFTALGKGGFVLAVEVRGIEPIPQGQVTLILPNAGARPESLFGALRLIANLAKAKVNEKKIEGRAVSWLDLGPVAHLAWWVEGKHAVLALATDNVTAMVKGMRGGGQTRLTANPLFKRLAAFKAFETSARAYVDVAALVKLAGARNRGVAKVLTDLGLDGLKSAVFYSGFDGPAERGLVELDAPGPRKGLLALFTGKPFTLADVPALPPDVVSWSMTNFDAGGLYDVGLQAAEDVVKLVAPDDLPRVREFTRQADLALGIDLRKDLLGALGDKVVQYNSPSEGPLNLGQTFVFKVRDGAKVQESLDQVAKGLAKLAGVEVRVKKRTYRGVVVREFHVRQQGFFFVPSYAIHKDWLVVGYFPQQVQGFIARARGELPAWKPSPTVESSLKQLPREFLSISYQDPRPSLKQLLSIAPLIGGLIDSFNPEANFDVGSLPNAQEATSHLFPNVSVTGDDGKTLRQETRASLALPLDLTGVDTYAIFFGFSLARFGGF